MTERKQKFHPPIGGRMAGGDKAKDVKGTTVKLLRYMRKDLFVIILAFALAIGGAVATVIVPDVLSGATDVLVDGAMEKTVYNSVVPRLKFDDETLAFMDAYPRVPLGYVRKLIEEGGENAVDPNVSEIIAQLPQQTKQAILSLPKTETVDNIRLVTLADASRNSRTVGEFIDKLGIEASDLLSQIPEAYRQSVMSVSFYEKPQIDFDAIMDIVAKLIALVVASGIMAYLQGFLLAGVAQKISYRFRRQLNEKIDRLPLKFYDKTTNGEVMSLITNDIDTIATSLNQSMSQLLTSITTVVGVFIMMLKISPLMTLIAVVSVPVLLALAMIIIKNSQKYFKRQQQYLGHVNGHIEEMFSGQNVVKLFNGEGKSIEEFKKYNDELYSSACSSQFFSGLMQPCAKVIGNLSFVGVCVLGGYLVVSGPLGVGNIQAFVQYVKQFNQPITQLASVANTFQSTIAAAERVFKFLEEKEEVESGDFSVDKIEGDVEFDSVRFGYSSDKVIIKNFNGFVAKGKRVAIVGPTGAGKTTIVKLLMRYYDLDSGKITVDGRDIKEFSRAGLRKHIGMVLQDTWLFNGTIMENIRYGRLDATDEEVIKAAKLACADHFIRILPEGYNFVINADANNISQGQKQLLTIARAILADSEIMILDEATSLVDTRTEMLIQQAMNTLMEGRTCFVIAHRLSTIKDADMILVLKDGDIVEQGTHEELLERGGFYSELYNAQFLGISIDECAKNENSAEIKGF
ncbi:MAG: ABC transporter ATP-binding protein [Clostridia bacterium]|nr:ABC transporter ATP-binding protein [Clostridia bacterium]